jgi:hypothetical protein
MGSSFEYGGLLSRDRVDRLDRLGFVWDVHQVSTRMVPPIGLFSIYSFVS